MKFKVTRSQFIKNYIQLWLIGNFALFFLTTLLTSLQSNLNIYYLINISGTSIICIIFVLLGLHYGEFKEDPLGDEQ